MNLAILAIVNILAILTLIFLPRYLRKRKESKKREKLFEQMLNSTLSAKSELISFLNSKRSEFYSEEAASRLNKLEADLQELKKPQSHRSPEAKLLESKIRVEHHDLMFGSILPEVKENDELEFKCIVYLMNEHAYCILAKGFKEKERLEERLVAVVIFLKALNSSFMFEFFHPKFNELRD